MSETSCKNVDSRHLAIIVGLKKGVVTFHDEQGNDATEKTVRHCDYLRWYTAYGRLDFEFPDGHPFSPDPQPITSPGFGNTVRVVFADPIETKYNVVLTDSASTEHRVDPKVIIDNGTQDFGASRRPSIFATILKVGLVAAAIATAVVVSAIVSEDTRD